MWRSAACWDGKWGGTNVPRAWDQEVIPNGVMSARTVTRILSVKWNSEKWKKRIHIPLRWGIFVITFIPSWIGALAWNLNIGDKNSADICVLDWNYTLLWRFQKLETWTHQTSEAIVMPCFMPGDLWPLMIHNDTCIWFEFQTKVHQGHNPEVNLMSAWEPYPIRRCASGARKCRYNHLLWWESWTYNLTLESVRSLQNRMLLVNRQRGQNAVFPCPTLTQSNEIYSELLETLSNIQALLNKFSIIWDRKASKLFHFN